MTTTKEQQDYADAMQRLATATKKTVAEVDKAFKRYVGQGNWRDAFLVVYSKSTRGDHSWMEASAATAPALPKQKPVRQARQQHQDDPRRKQPE